MKKFAFLSFILVTALTAKAQLPDYDNIKLGNATECKAAEGAALTAAKYLFTTPFSDENLPRVKSLKFIIQWMSATPDYKFTLDKVTEKVTKGNDNLMGLYMAGMTKYVLENPSPEPDPDVIKVKSVEILLDYCGNPSNNMKMTKQIKSLAEARSNGTLAEALK